MLRLHPENPRYLLFEGEPTVLITSGEHYGAVTNADFDYTRYLDELAEYGFNQTRLFAGSYVKSQTAPTPNTAALGHNDTLTPPPGRFISPWAQTEDGKYDLVAWNPEYFERLRGFVAGAAERGIIVELTLFSALVDQPRWMASPFNAANNVNAVGDIDAHRLYTLENGGVLSFQDAFVRKHVRELRSFANVYFEVINEGWVGPAPASDEWQAHVIETIAAAEARLPRKHLIARNYDHTVGRITDPHPSVSIHNFHIQPDVSQYANLEGVLAFDETGFQGTGDLPYRTDGWLFMLSGGGVYSNLDYSFTADHEDGTFELPPDAPGGGGASLRRQLSVLKRFLERFDLPEMAPRPEAVVSAPAGSASRVLADPGRAYAVYLSGGRPGPLVLDLAPGRYRAQWINPLDGGVMGEQGLEHTGGAVSLNPPSYEEDIALAIERVTVGG